MKCNHCGKPFTKEEIEAKKKQKSDLIKLARKEAKDRGEQVGAKIKYDRCKIRELRAKGMTIREIAKEMKCSISPVQDALKGKS